MRHTCGTKYLVSSKHIGDMDIYETMVFPMTLLDYDLFYESYDVDYGNELECVRDSKCGSPCFLLILR